jgi:hypothetical protein
MLIYCTNHTAYLIPINTIYCTVRAATTHGGAVAGLAILFVTTSYGIRLKSLDLTF